jgi:hypothetical protein
MSKKYGLKTQQKVKKGAYEFGVGVPSGIRRIETKTPPRIQSPNRRELFNFELAFKRLFI